MSLSIQRKPSSETPATGVSTRVSSKKAKTGIISEQTLQSDEDLELDQSVSDMQHLTPLISKLEIGGSLDPVGLESRTNQTTTYPLGSTSTASGSHTTSKINRKSLDKPLPQPPAAETPANDPVEWLSGLHPHPGVRPSVNSRARSERGLQQNKVTAADLDLSNTEDTQVHTNWAPAITHETIKQDLHHVEERRITREHHEHHIFHRILPIHDVEVLPAKHYVEVNGCLQEVAEDQLPNRISVASKNARRLISEGYSKSLPQDSGSSSPRQFTARTFPDTEGDYKEYVSPTGSTQTERWWVHPPTLENGGRQSGQTRPFHLGSPDPADDGLRDS